MATPGRMGAAAGTTYLAFTVTLTAGDPCFIHAWPDVDIVDDAGAVVDASDHVDGAEIWLLEKDLPFHLGWASWCADPPTGRLTARLDFVDGAVTDLPLPVGFGPSGCNGSDSILFVEPTANEVIEPAR